MGYLGIFTPLGLLQNATSSKPGRRLSCSSPRYRFGRERPAVPRGRVSAVTGRRSSSETLYPVRFSFYLVSDPERSDIEVVQRN